MGGKMKLLKILIGVGVLGVLFFSNYLYVQSVGNREADSYLSFTFDSLDLEGDVPFELEIHPMHKPSIRLESSGKIFFNEKYIASDKPLVISIIRKAHAIGLFNLSDEVLEWRYSHTAFGFPDSYNQKHPVHDAGDKNVTTIIFTYNSKPYYEFISNTSITSISHYKEKIREAGIYCNFFDMLHEEFSGYREEFKRAAPYL